MTRSRPISFVAGAALIALTALSVAACGSSGSGTAASQTPKLASRHTPTVSVAKTELGKILVDSHGRTLYLFTKDSGTTSACSGACATAWPPLSASGTPTVGGGASASLLGTTMRSDGTSQVTYNGHPLYTFVKDKKRGDTNGEGLTAFGGSWFTVSPAGKQVSNQQSAAPAPAAPKPAPTPAPPAPAPTPSATPTPPPSSNSIPQNNGGDQDSDNNGGPDDGDGGI
jgi:predicted lipoprotein with Yx(FWY)xxD motif